jgi:hypothetical protein
MSIVKRMPGPFLPLSSAGSKIEYKKPEPEVEKEIETVDKIEKIEVDKIEKKEVDKIEKKEKKSKTWIAQEKCIKCRGIINRSCRAEKCYNAFDINGRCIIYSAQIGENDEIVTLLFCDEKCIKKSGLDMEKNVDKSKGKLVTYGWCKKLAKKFCTEPLHHVDEADWCSDCGNPESGIRCSFCGIMDIWKGYKHHYKRLVCCQRDECISEAGIWIRKKAWVRRKDPIIAATSIYTESMMSIVVDVNLLYLIKHHKFVV